VVFYSTLFYSIEGGGTALHFATLKDHLLVVQYLLQQGADVEMRTEMWGHTPLHWAAHDNRIQCLSMLLYHCRVNHISPDQASNSGDTPLIVAAYQGHLPCATLLAECGADIHIHGMDDRDACNWAAKRRHAHVVEFLIGAGADLEMKPGRHKSVIEIAKKHKGINAAVERGLSAKLSKLEFATPLVSLMSMDRLELYMRECLAKANAELEKATVVDAVDTLETAIDAKDEANAEPVDLDAAADQFSGFRRETISVSGSASSIDTNADTTTSAAVAVPEAVAEEAEEAPDDQAQS
jgi:Ankyrin repeats (3 copies)/Ankyrin repeat